MRTSSSWPARPRVKVLLLNTATEELAHIEMLSTAVALNLEGGGQAVSKGVDSASPAIQSMLGGINQKNYLSSGNNAMPIDSDGVPFDMSHIYASGNLAADMYANVAAESTGRLLAARLYELTDDPGMKDMLSFLIARDAMHQNQWLAVIEELGGPETQLPIPNSFPEDMQNRDFAYAFVSTAVDGADVPEGRWSQGRSIDGKGEFQTVPAKPLGPEPQLSTPPKGGYAQAEQMAGGPGQSDQLGSQRPAQKGGGVAEKVKDALT